MEDKGGAGGSGFIITVVNSRKRNQGMKGSFWLTVLPGGGGQSRAVAGHIASQEAETG